MRDISKPHTQHYSEKEKLLRREGQRSAASQKCGISQFFFLMLGLQA